MIGKNCSKRFKRKDRSRKGGGLGRSRRSYFRNLITTRVCQVQDVGGKGGPGEERRMYSSRIAHQGILSRQKELVIRCSCPSR